MDIKKILKAGAVTTLAAGALLVADVTKVEAAEWTKDDQKEWVRLNGTDESGNPSYPSLTADEYNKLTDKKQTPSLSFKQIDQIKKYDLAIKKAEYDKEQEELQFQNKDKKRIEGVINSLSLPAEKKKEYIDKIKGMDLFNAVQLEDKLVAEEKQKFERVKGNLEAQVYNRKFDDLDTKTGVSATQDAHNAALAKCKTYGDLEAFAKANGYTLSDATPTPTPEKPADEGKKPGKDDKKPGKDDKKPGKDDKKPGKDDKKDNKENKDDKKDNKENKDDKKDKVEETKKDGKKDDKKALPKTGFVLGSALGLGAIVTAIGSAVTFRRRK